MLVQLRAVPADVELSNIRHVRDVHYPPGDRPTRSRVAIPRTSTLAVPAAGLASLGILSKASGIAVLRVLVVLRRLVAGQHSSRGLGNENA